MCRPDLLLMPGFSVQVATNQQPKESKQYCYSKGIHVGCNMKRLWKIYETSIRHYPISILADVLKVCLLLRQIL